MTSIKEKILRGDNIDDVINADIEASVRRLAAAIEWTPLISKAMAGDPAPLRQAIVQIHGRKDLYPPELVDFLALMEENKPRQGRPQKDGKESLRAAAKAWQKAWKTEHYKSLRYLLGKADKYDTEPVQRMSVTAEPHNINVRFWDKKEAVKKNLKVVRLHGTGTPAELALALMYEADMCSGPEAIRNEIYPRKKKVQRKG